MQNTKPFDALEGAEPLPVAVGQALTLRTALEDGVSLQTAKQIDLVTETVYDLEGYPFYHLTIAGYGLRGFWETVDTFSEGGQYWLAATGATKARSILSFQGEGADLLRSLRDTKAAMGAKPKRIVGASMTVLYLQDAQGRLWSLGAQKPVETSSVQAAREQYTLARKRNNDPEFARKLKEDWDALLAEKKDAPGPRPSSQTNFLTAGFIKPDGTLDVSKAIDSIGTYTKPMAQVDNSDHVSLQYNQEMWACEGWWIFCTTVYSKKVLLPSQQNQINNTPYPQKWDVYHQMIPDYWGTFLGNDQWASQWNRNPEGFKLDDWLPTGQLFSDAPLGCGPASFIRLVSWYWKNNGTYGSSLQQPSWYGLSYNSNFAASTGYNGWPIAKDREIGFRMTAPVSNCQFCGLPGQSSFNWSPEIAAKMGTKFFVNGGLTHPNGVESGGNSWLIDRGSNWRVRSSMYAIDSRLAWTSSSIIGWVSWSQWTWRTADIVRSAIGSRNVPIAFAHAIPNTAGFGGHYQPSMQYKVYTRVENAIVLVELNMDTFKGTSNYIPQGMYSITDSYLNYGGAYGIY